MSTTPSLDKMKLVYEKYLPKPIYLCKWSPKIDVCLLVAETGELYLYRYSLWQNVWTIQAKDKDPRVTVIEWSMEGRVVAIGRDNGVLQLYEIENGEILFECQVGSEIVCLKWDEYPLPDFPGMIKIEQTDKFFSQHFPKPLLLFDGKETKSRRQEILFEQKKDAPLSEKLSLLLVGDKNGNISLYVDGIFYICSYQITPQINRIITALHMSSDLNSITVISKNENNHASLQMISCGTFNRKARLFQLLAFEFSSIVFIIDYIHALICNMSENYESVLSKLDLKLSKFVAMLPDGVLVADEFLTLLSMGNNRPELLQFITHDLSFTIPKNKRLSSAIENSHQTFSDLISSDFLTTCEMLYYKLAHLSNTMRFHEYIKLGYTSELFDRCLVHTGCLMLKSIELLKVIETSKDSFQVFFEWINIIDAKLQDTKTENSLTFSQYEILIDFLINHLKQSKPPDVKFNVEIVEQYFLNEPLSTVQETFTPWIPLAEKVMPSDYPLIKADKTASLVQLFHVLKEKINTVFKEPTANISKMLFKEICCENLQDLPLTHKKPIMCERSNGIHLVYAMNAPLDDCLFILRFVKSEIFYAFAKFHTSDRPLTIHSLFEYNDDYIAGIVTPQTSLISEGNIYFIPFSATLSAKFFPISSKFPPLQEIDSIAVKIEFSNCIKLDLKKFPIGNCINISGGRNLAIFVSNDGKRINIYDLNSSEQTNLEEMETSPTLLADS